MDLHPAIEAYFTADRGNDGDALAAAFAPDATVFDEGHKHLGREAIRTWWSETKAQYQAEFELLDASRVDDATRVRALVSGNFAGSPAVLTFAFQLADDRIGALEIGA